MSQKDEVIANGSDKLLEPHEYRFPTSIRLIFHHASSTLVFQGPLAILMKSLEAGNIKQVT